MNFYFAPMEGVTDYIYRNAHNKYFGGVDKYFTPFIVTNQHGKYKSRDWEGILPEHNKGINVVPQILTNYSSQFIATALDLNRLGYQEVNLNLGCPSGTVVAKFKGSGFLAKPDELNLFLEEIFRNLQETGPKMKISIKTRIGKDDPEEFTRLLEIYNQYPMEELIIHPRVQQDYYKNSPKLEQFQQAIDNSNHSLCYNGDIINKDSYLTIEETFPTITKIMIGRGLVANPALISTIQNRKRKESNISKELLLEFHNKIYKDYQGVLFGDKNVLFRAKELWLYMIELFTNHEKYWKKIRKAQHLDEYEKIIKKLFEEEDLESL